MNKKCIFLLLVLVIFISMCSVNGTTGLLVITNLTDNPIENIKIGDYVLTSYLANGAKYDFWYFSQMSGKLTGNGIDVVIVPFLIESIDVEEDGQEYTLDNTLNKDDVNCIFKLNYQYHLDIKNVDNEYRLYVNPGVSTGKFGESTELDYPSE